MTVGIARPPSTSGHILGNIVGRIPCMVGHAGQANVVNALSALSSRVGNAFRWDATNGTARESSASLYDVTRIPETELGIPRNMAIDLMTFGNPA